MAAQNAGGLENIQEKLDKFRILIIGRPNAGITTILRAIWDFTKNPEVDDGKGNKINLTQVEGSEWRDGIYNVENEIIFRSKPELIFYDSRGFEAGYEDEFQQLKAFIADRAKTTLPQKRIHAIWYCIPMDKLERAIQRESEEIFFEECDTGKIPVIVLFTKYDALLTIAMAQLDGADRKLPWEEKMEKAHQLSDQIFYKADLWGHLSKLKHAPKYNVRIGGMNNSNEGCNLLLEITKRALNEG